MSSTVISLGALRVKEKKKKKEKEFKQKFKQSFLFILISVEDILVSRRLSTFIHFIWFIARILVTIVLSWEILRYPNEEQYLPVSVQ